MTIAGLAWPAARVGEALQTLALHSNLIVDANEALTISSHVQEGGVTEIARWLDWAGKHIGVDIEPIDTALQDFEALLKNANPSLLYANHSGIHGFFVLLKSKGSRLVMIAPDLSLKTCNRDDLYAWLVAPYAANFEQDIQHILKTANISEKKRHEVIKVLLKDRTGQTQIGHCWMLRLPASAPIKTQLFHAKIPQRFLWMIALLFVVYAIEMSGWGLIGKVTLNDHFDLGWFNAWCLLIFTLLLADVLSSWIEAKFALDISRIFKQRLLYGALHIKLDQVKHLGVGQLLSSVMESQAIESLIFNGGVAVFIAIVELILAAWVLSNGVGGSLHLLLLFGWTVLTLLLTTRYYKKLATWTTNRFDMTNQLVESMVGQRTRIAQEPLSRRHIQEDQMMQHYLQLSQRMDNAYVPITSVLPTGWLLLGILGLSPAFISGNAQPVDLAITLGGVLFANRALTGISTGLTAMARAGIAWRHVAEFFKAVNSHVSKAPYMMGAQLNKRHGDAVLQISNLSYRYPEANQSIFEQVDFSLKHGERILLEGGSGSGKSTLASIIVGLRKPDSGLLLLNGLDHHTLGEAWHQLVTESPQFHENHILNGPLAFNLLMGRNWPASEAEMDEAHAVCTELGLDDLINRMPAGLLQIVGETGWQLSHGEKSRIFLARALLQKAQITILDESFASLDPKTLKTCLQCAFKYTQTLIVIAHP